MHALILFVEKIAANFLREDSTMPHFACVTYMLEKIFQDYESMTAYMCCRIQLDRCFFSGSTILYNRKKRVSSAETT